MLKVEIQVIHDGLSKLSSKLRKEASKAVKSAADEGSKIAKQFAPVDTGELQSEIHREDEDELTSSTVSSVPHSIFNEFGTVKMSPNPYMTPMAEMMRSKFIQRMSDIPEQSAN